MLRRPRLIAFGVVEGKVAREGNRELRTSSRHGVVSVASRIGG